MATNFELELTAGRLAKQLAEAADKEISDEVQRLLTERIQPVIDEAAKRVTALIRPVLTKMVRDPLSGEIHVTLLLNNEVFKP